MKRLSLRLSICVAAAALSCAPFMAVQAESHKPFYSRLNPKTWFKKDQPEGRAKVIDEQPKVAPGSATTSVRPHLTEDPFALPPQDGAKSPSTNEKPRTQTVETAKPQIAPTLPQRSAMTAEGDFEEFGTNTKTAAKPADSRTPRKASSGADANQFEEGFDTEFDALVKSVQREKQSAAPSLPELPDTKTAARAQAAFDDESEPVAARKEAKGGATEALNDFEQFVAEQEAGSTTKANDTHPIEQRVAKSMTPLAKPKRQILDPDTPAADESSPSLEPREVVAQSRREMEASPLRSGFASDDSAAPSREADGSKLTQTSGTAARMAERAASISKSRSNQLPEVRAGLATRDDLPLIVPNDQVPERKLYVASQTYRAQSAVTQTRTATTETAATTVAEPTLPAVSTSLRQTAPDEVAPRVSANRAPALTLPEPAKVRQLAFEDQAPEPRLPLLSIGGNSAPASNANGPLLFPSTALDGDAKPESAKEIATSRERAPTIDWPEANEATAPAKKKSGALMMVVAIAAIGVGLGFMLRKKAAVATTGGTAVGDSPEMGS